MNMNFENSQSPFPSPSSSSSTCSSCPNLKRKAGRTKFKETRHPVYRGVRRRNGNKWVSEVREPNKKSKIWLGTYPTPEMAARAHDAAVLSLRGTSALLNFPDSASLLPHATTSSPSDIRAAAAKAAKSHSMSSSSLSSSSSPPHHHNDTDSCLLKEKSLCLRDESRNKNLEDSSTLSTERNKNIKNEECRTMFLDEEALYNMPALLDSMAEGLLLTPPSMIRALDWDNFASSSHDVDLTLWTH